LNRDSTAIEDLDGYNVYRSVESGQYGFDPINISVWEDTTYIDFTASPDTAYYYVVKAVDTLGYESHPSNEVSSPGTSVSGGDGSADPGLRRLWLSPAFPNPFSRGTSVTYVVPASGAGERSQVEVSVYNLQGQRVKTLLDGNLLPGRQSIEWDATDGGGHRVGSGVYFFSLEAGGSRLTRKAVVLR
jgi:hypothetical protein